MSQERIVSARAFGVEPNQKFTTQEWVRQSIIPKLIEREAPAERSLLALHYASTWNLQNNDRLPPSRRYEEVVRELRSGQGEPDRQIVGPTWRIIDGGDPKVKISLPPERGRGRYRVLGDIEEDVNGKLRKQRIWQFRAIQQFTRDGEFAYIAPQKDIDLLMHKLSQEYDNIEAMSKNPVDTALNLAFLYTIGNKLIHPFTDGNHRAFDRFLEYGFAKANISFKLPQDQSGNIPKEERFRVWTGNFVTNFLRLNNLPLFSHKPPRTTYDAYQEKLTKSLDILIGRKLNNPFSVYLYAAIAGEMLKWTPNDHASEISAIQEKAKRDGGFAVLTR